MADTTNTELQPYEPDPAEVKKAYWILGGIFVLIAVFMYALIETVMRHGNPLEVLGIVQGGGGGH